MMKNKMALIMSVILLFFTAMVADCWVYVNGYFRSDGTYVAPHYRSYPDGNPYNNWSFPGNINPWTGKIATGNPYTYLLNYYNRRTRYYLINPNIYYGTYYIYPW